MEIERKFLIADPPDLGDTEGDPIEQGYLALVDDEGGAEVRLRRKAGRHLLTVKAGRGRSRAEEEIELDSHAFERLWPLTEGRRVTKTRYRLPCGARQIELDLYSGDLAGLAVAEVEFPDEGAADAFEPPPWFGDEVTGDHQYLNETLATRGRPR
jgi:CYTH domain-containing protein